MSGRRFKVDATSPLAAIRQLAEQFRSHGLADGMWHYEEPTDDTTIVFAIGTVRALSTKPPIEAAITAAQRAALDKLRAWERRSGTRPWANEIGVRSDLLERLVDMGLLDKYEKVDVRPQRYARYQLSPVANRLLDNGGK